MALILTDIRANICEIFNFDKYYYTPTKPTIAFKISFGNVPFIHNLLHDDGNPPARGLQHLQQVFNARIFNFPPIHRNGRSHNG